MKDEIVEEMWEAGIAYLARFGFDLTKAAEDLRAKEKATGRLIADLKPVQPRKKEPAAR